MNSARLSRVLWDLHSDHRIDALDAGNCRQSNVQRCLRTMLPRNDPSFRILLTGSSIEGRPLPLVQYGNGPIRILFWSQMHGDESTATLALMDMLSCFANDGLRRAGMAHIRQHCTLFMIPILNPDGAERRIRHTAAGIDMNRDARRFTTPEARFLRNVHRLVRPSFGFNLHDQDLSTVGTSASLTAIALLAPAADPARRISPTRRRAMQIASVIAKSLKPMAGKRLARYKDDYEPRAFGDTMQSWGTSTVLIESGHWENDPGKKMIRKLNFVGLLSAIQSIATGSFRGAGLREYSGLQENGKRAYAIVVRGAGLAHKQNGLRADVGLQLEKKNGKTIARVKEVGDLKDFGAIFSLSGKGVMLNTHSVQAENTLSLRRLNRVLNGGLPSQPQV